MKRFIALLFAVVLFASCDDGDIIVTDFDFDAESELQMCKSGNKNVLYIINNDPVESIVFTFADEDFDGRFADDIESEERVISLGGDNELIYRTFDEQINGKNYYCTGVPPSEPAIKTEFRNKDGGRIDLITTVIDQEVDELDGTVTKTFRTHAVARDFTLKNSHKEEEIVRETMHLGSFTKTATYDL